MAHLPRPPYAVPSPRSLLCSWVRGPPPSEIHHIFVTFLVLFPLPNALPSLNPDELLLSLKSPEQSPSLLLDLSCFWSLLSWSPAALCMTFWQPCLCLLQSTSEISLGVAIANTRLQPHSGIVKHLFFPSRASQPKHHWHWGQSILCWMSAASLASIHSMPPASPVVLPKQPWDIARSPLGERSKTILDQKLLLSREMRNIRKPIEQWGFQILTTDWQA